MTPPITGEGGGRGKGRGSDITIHSVFTRSTSSLTGGGGKDGRKFLAIVLLPTELKRGSIELALLIY